MRFTIKLKLGLALGLIISLLIGATLHTSQQPANAVIAQQARVKGFALDLSSGRPNAEDVGFRETA